MEGMEMETRKDGGLTQIIGESGDFRTTRHFALACLIYHATCTFCRRTCGYRSDPLGKTSGQMIGAARSARQNIVEGSTCAGTSRETELRLHDVARGSLAELAGDYEAFLTERNELPWATDDALGRQLDAIPLDAYAGSTGEDARREYTIYVQKMRKRFEAWLETPDSVLAAKSILRKIDEADKLLTRHICVLAEDFRENGGFRERLTAARLEWRDNETRAQGTPTCPKCGKPMRRKISSRGSNIGNAFWGCVDYPQCDGMRTMSCADE